MIKRPEIRDKSHAHEPAGHRHHELEQAKMEGQAEHGPPVPGKPRGSRSQGDGCRIHGQANGNDDNVKNFHDNRY